MRAELRVSEVGTFESAVLGGTRSWLDHDSFVGFSLESGQFVSSGSDAGWFDSSVDLYLSEVWD